MYLANLYVSLLDLIADGIEASLDVLISLVKSAFLHLLLPKQLCVGKRSNFKKIPTHTQDHGDA